MSEQHGVFADISLGEAAVLIRAAPRSRIVTHRNPDGDSVGSATALAYAIFTLGGHATVYSPDPLPDYLLEVPGASTITTGWDDGEFDLLIAVDVSDPDLLRPLPCASGAYFSDCQSLNLDHHYSNLRFARQNHVDATAASATELVFDLVVRELGVPLNAELATCLLYGVVNDTHSFQNSNTTPRTLRLSADLVESGADLSAIVFNLLLEKRPASARLWALVLPTLTFADGERVAMLTVTLGALQAAGATMTDADGLVEFLRNIRHVDLAVLFKQTAADQYRLSMRSSEAVDATLVAAEFGGGGHQRAAGGDAVGPLAEIQQRLVAVYHDARR